VPGAPDRNGRGEVGGGRKRTLVVGCGFIGSHIVSELAAAGRPPIVFTRSRPADEVAAAIAPGDLHIGDAAEPAALARAVGEDVAEVVYAAGGLLPAAAEQDPERDAELTLAPLRAVLAALRERPGARLTYISSGGTVYGEPDELPVSEEAPTRPIATYGRLHLRCEEEIRGARERWGVRARILRCSTVYGEHQLPDRGQGAVTTFLHRIESGLPIELYGGGATIRDYVYAPDVGRAVVDLLSQPEGPEVLNVGSGEGTSLLELLRLVEAELGRSGEVIAHDERRFDVHRIVLDVGRLRRLVDFRPTPLPEGIARTHAWLRRIAAGPPATPTKAT
jgi:UDP-glucose 4-epimerase